jgi:beta-galactosidase
MSEIPAFPYGAVYFRKSNPPHEDWARDYQTAAEDGINIMGSVRGATHAG